MGLQLMIDVANTPTAQLRAIRDLLTIELDGRAEPLPEGFRTDAEILAASEVGFGKTAPPAQAATQAATTAPPPAAPPAAAPPPAATQAATVEVDSAGAPYDPNVHSSSKAKLKDGTWKKRRGGPAEAKTAPPPPATTEPARLPSSASVAGNDQVGAAAVAAVAPPPATAPGATFRSVVNKANGALAAGKLTAEAILAIVKQAGAPDLQTLNAMAHLIPQVDLLLDAALLGK